MFKDISNYSLVKYTFTTNAMNRMTKKIKKVMVTYLYSLGLVCSQENILQKPSKTKKNARSNPKIKDINSLWPVAKAQIL